MSGYYWIFCQYIFKIDDLPVAKISGDNGPLYGDTKTETIVKHFYKYLEVMVNSNVHKRPITTAGSVRQN